MSASPGNLSKPLLRGHFHQAMFFVALGALVPLLMEAKGTKELVSLLIYSVCALFLFGISALYHRVDWKSSRARIQWRKLDHAGIFLMIAGTFTPVALLGLDAPTSYQALGLIWGVALVGAVQSFFFPHLPKWANALIYLVAGGLTVPYLRDLAQNLKPTHLWLIVFGGAAYVLGAVCYGLKWPRLSPRVFSYHEVFHILVNVGATLHFFAIHSLIRLT